MVSFNKKVCGLLKQLQIKFLFQLNVKTFVERIEKSNNFEAKPKLNYLPTKFFKFIKIYKQIQSYDSF